VFDEHGAETSGQDKPLRVELMDGHTGIFIGEGFGLFVDPATDALGIAEAVDEGEPDPQAKVPSDYEVYFAAMVVAAVVPVVAEHLLDGDYISEAMDQFYRPPYEDHPLPKPPDGGL
jgi:hypothetical protein